MREVVNQAEFGVCGAFTMSCSLTFQRADSRIHDVCHKTGNWLEDAKPRLATSSVHERGAMVCMNSRRDATNLAECHSGVGGVLITMRVTP